MIQKEFSELNAQYCIYTVMTVEDLIIITADINKCALNISGCAHNCTNNNGSYNIMCSCSAGYGLDSSRHLCEGAK